MGRILGPRGNSLKRVEASTGCRVFIRGKGSIKDADKVTLICLGSLCYLKIQQGFVANDLKTYLFI